METATIESLAGQVGRIERRNDELSHALRRWRLAAGGAAAALALVALAGAAADGPGIVEAEQFVLVDRDGNPLGRWTVREDGTPGLALFDTNGRLRLSLDLGADGTSGVNVYDADGGPRRAALAVRPDGTPGLGLFNEQGHPRASVDLGADGSTGVNLYGWDGGPLRVSLAIRADGTPALGLFDERGQVVRSIELPDQAGAGQAPAAFPSPDPAAFGARGVPVGG
jgi:hypothetical protein